MFVHFPVDVLDKLWVWIWPVPEVSLLIQFTLILLVLSVGAMMLGNFF